MTYFQKLVWIWRESLAPIRTCIVYTFDWVTSPQTFLRYFEFEWDYKKTMEEGWK